MSNFYHRQPRAWMACLVAILLLVACSPKPYETPRKEPGAFDVVVYGATPSGIAAAISAAREGRTVALVGALSRVGGMMTSGLGHTDLGDVRTVGGFAQEFFKRIGEYYGKTTPVYRFESKAAHTVFTEMLKESGVFVWTGEPLHHVRRRGHRILSLTTLGGQFVRGRVFIDASYEGDLMARAGVSYAVGREGADVFGERFAGFQTDKRRHIFPTPVPATYEDGTPVAGVNADGWAPIGTGDKKVPAYNFRLCLTKRADNRVAIQKPESYDVKEYELMARYLRVTPQLKLSDVLYFFPLPNDKYDINNRGPVSSNYIGMNWDYPEAGPKRRQIIWQAHKDYLHGLLYFLRSDPRVPNHVRDAMRPLGFCADEFEETDHWPPQLYVREARRMRGSYVLSEKDIVSERRKPDVIAYASMPIESHHVQRLLHPRGTAVVEGSVVVPVQPWAIPYRALVPLKSEITNLINSVTISSSHVAYSSLRMEPVFLMLGHGAGLAASDAAANSLDVQDIDINTLQGKLRAAGQVLEFG